MKYEDINGIFHEDSNNILFTGEIYEIKCKYVISKKIKRGNYFMGINSSVNISEMKEVEDKHRKELYKTMMIKKITQLNDVFLTENEMNNIISLSNLEINLKKYNYN